MDTQQLLSAMRAKAEAAQAAADENTEVIIVMKKTPLETIKGAAVELGLFLKGPDEYCPCHWIRWRISDNVTIDVETERYRMETNFIGYGRAEDLVAG